MDTQLKIIRKKPNKHFADSGIADAIRFRRSIVDDLSKPNGEKEVSGRVIETPQMEQKTMQFEIDKIKFREPTMDDFYSHLRSLLYDLIYEVHKPTKEVQGRIIENPQIEDNHADPNHS
ncbi:hypothetical protein EHQ53_14105 [Leptospira langatensis]|uniref:Uncharacterized protein n=1 Tax=Leptospira langatensis TaxID=2484983 RepID=A0ABY2MDH2_9LEPT|nr:hypothetical protein [Leptospira langatensis]TGL39651.1 hypothetical protein EHQ53_14105 [Leptospira langatensis]